MKNLYTFLKAQLFILIISHCMFGQVQKIFYSGTNVTIEVSGSIYGKDLSPSLDDPFSGVLVWGVSNEQDGSAGVAQILQGTHYYKSQPDVWSFTSNPAVDYVYVSAIHHSQHETNEGSFSNIADRLRGKSRKVVLVEFPRKGAYSVGFITVEASGEIQEKIEKLLYGMNRIVKIFFPFA